MRLEADLQLLMDTSIGVLPRWVIRRGGIALERAERTFQQLPERSEPRRYLQRVYPRRATSLELEQQSCIIAERIRLFEIRAGVTKQVRVIFIKNLLCCYLFRHFGMLG